MKNPSTEVLLMALKTISQIYTLLASKHVTLTQHK